MQEVIKIKYFSEDAKKLEKIAQGDWIDLYSNEDIKLAAGENKIIPLGVAMQLPSGYEAHLAPRSSTFKKWGILQTNSVGVIDESYCGDNDQWGMSVYATRDTEIRKGDKICQFRIIKKQPSIFFVRVDELNNVDRGGFGSTGSR